MASHAATWSWSTTRTWKYAESVCSTTPETSAVVATTKWALYGVRRALVERGLGEKEEGQYVVSSCFSGSGPL